MRNFVRHCISWIFVFYFCLVVFGSKNSMLHLNFLLQTFIISCINLEINITFWAYQNHTYELYILFLNAPKTNSECSARCGIIMMKVKMFWWFATALSLRNSAAKISLGFTYHRIVNMTMIFMTIHENLLHDEWNYK